MLPPQIITLLRRAYTLDQIDGIQTSCQLDAAVAKAQELLAMDKKREREQEQARLLLQQQQLVLAEGARQRKLARQKEQEEQLQQQRLLQTKQLEMAYQDWAAGVARAFKAIEETAHSEDRSATGHEDESAPSSTEGDGHESDGADMSDGNGSNGANAAEKPHVEKVLSVSNYEAADGEYEDDVPPVCVNDYPESPDVRIGLHRTTR